ncbi:MAG: PepSY domain-containing protein [Hyphomicrobiales bacterium]|nr:MAG: PepSY domain-containing protein [Hyphomicrobiales bacterium]
MWTVSQGKRCVFLVHRWTGVAACVLMALWVVSGVVMLFVGYPKLLPSERLASLPPLPASACCVPVEAALRHSRAPQAVQQITLTTIAGRPSYRLKEGDGSLRVVDAMTGVIAPAVDGAAALRSAQLFMAGAGGTGGALRGQTQDDRWTHSGLLDPHRPLFQVQMEDEAGTLLYVSSATGEVVMDAPLQQRYWNFVGAWLHWVYMFREGSRDPVWSWLVIGLSAVGTLSALAGAVVGIWRWRFAGHYKCGAKTPYREFQMRWHHITGLVFGAVMVLWIFSGLMSMNPLGVFSAAQPPDLKAYRQGVPGSVRPALSTAEAIALIHAQGFAVNELEWRVLGGHAYLLAYDATAASRLVVSDESAQSNALLFGDVPTGAASRASHHHVREQFDMQALEAFARPLLPAPIDSAQTLEQHDAYYLRRGAASMYAAAERDLPVLRLQFRDTGRTLVYISPYTGDVVLSADSAQSKGRWLFNLLHSWDLPWMLRHPIARDAVLAALSVGALGLALTGVVLGYRRLRLFVAHKRGKTGLLRA